MNPLLDLRLRITEHQVTIVAEGHLTALTAHLLHKVVVGTLRRHPTPALEIDLTRVTVIDFVGDVALQDCEYETQRRGIVLSVIRTARKQSPAPNTRAPRLVARRTRWWRPLTHTGTICRKRIASM